MITILDIARLAGVSKSTVSRVISRNGPVSEETRIKIEAIMVEHNYTPSYFAQGIRTGKTKTIAFMLPDSKNLFYNEMIVAVESIALENDYMVLICNTNKDPEREREYIESLLKRKVEGIIFCTYHTTEQNKRYLQELSKELPLVFMDNLYTQGEDVSCVISEGQNANRKAVKYLYDLGCRRIAYICVKSISIVNHRLEGYLQGLDDCGLSYAEELVYEAQSEERVDSHFQMGMDGAKKLLALREPPDAIMAAIDTMAIGAMRHILSTKYRVPEDIKIVGYDNIELSQMVTPTLTTIAQPIHTLGTEAAKLLLQKIKDNSINKRLLFGEELIIRNSTQPDL